MANKFSPTQALAATISGINRDVGKHPELLLTPQQQEEVRAMDKQRQKQKKEQVTTKIEIVDPETD